MRNQQRTINSYLSVWPHQPTYGRTNTARPTEKQTIQHAIQFFKENKKTIEIIGLIVGFGALFLGGSYLFLHQLAQYGW